MPERIIFLETTLARLLEWIRAADAKIPPILAISTSMLAIVAALLPKASEWNIQLFVAGIVAVIPLFICFIFLFLATFPRTQGPKGSLIYFEGIKTHDTDSYLTAVRQLTNEEYSVDLARQCLRNSEIASIKYQNLRIAMIALFLSVLPWLIFIFILYMEK